MASQVREHEEARELKFRLVLLSVGILLTRVAPRRHYGDCGWKPLQVDHLPPRAGPLWFSAVHRQRLKLRDASGRLDITVTIGNVEHVT